MFLGIKSRNTSREVNGIDMVVSESSWWRRNSGMMWRLEKNKSDQWL